MFDILGTILIVLPLFVVMGLGVAVMIRDLWSDLKEGN